MALIKSAVEIALEKTQEIKGDKAAIAAHEAREQGKRLASSFLADTSIDLNAKLKEVPSDRATWTREALLQTLMSNLSLPKEEVELNRADPVFKGFEFFAKDKGRLKNLKQQLTQLLKQYVDDRKRLTDTLTKQYAPVLRQKEEQLRRQYGRAVRLDPMADPDFVKALNQNIGALEARYGDVVDQAREEIKRLVGLSA